MDVKSSFVLSGCRDEARRHVPDRQFIAKIEMDMRCNSVGGEEGMVTNQNVVLIL